MTALPILDLLVCRLQACEAVSDVAVTTGRLWLLRCTLRGGLGHTDSSFCFVREELDWEATLHTLLTTSGAELCDVFDMRSVLSLRGLQNCYSICRQVCDSFRATTRPSKPHACCLPRVDTMLRCTCLRFGSWCFGLACCW